MKDKREQIKGPGEEAPSTRCVRHLPGVGREATAFPPHLPVTAHQGAEDANASAGVFVGRAYGPFHAEAVIGEGGMGVVMKARHAETGEQVALKTIKRVWEPLLRHIRREIRTLATLEHPGVVSIIDAGEQGGVPWYAMTLLDGEPLSLWRRQPQVSSVVMVEQDTVSAPLTAVSSSRPREKGGRVEALKGLQGEALTRLLRVIRRLCEPLAYLHSQGLVHRDLKPDNIMLSKGDEPIIFDFGLVSRFNRQTSRELAGTWRAEGTFRYMAPEQRAGERVNASADIYALGAILFELWVGAPWTHSDWPPSRWPYEEGYGLSRLLEAMLHRSPGRRPSARQVMAALDEFMRDSAVSLSLRPDPSLVLSRPPMVGRRKLLSAMGGFLREELKAGRGGVTLVLGDSGMGKTRLLAELTRRHRLVSAHVVSGQCHRLMSTEDRDAQVYGAPFGPLRSLLQLIGDRCRERGPQWWRRFGLHRWGRLFALYEPSLASVPWGEECLDPEQLSAERARDVLFEVLVDVMAGLAQEAPLVVMLDDLQWADDLTLGFMEFVGERRCFERAGVMILGACRQEDASGLRPVIEAPGVKSLSLKPFEEGDVRRMVAETLDTLKVPEGLNEILVQRAGGNPFFIIEYLQAAIAEERLTFDGAGRWRWSGALTLPASLRVLMERRAAHLSGPALSLARMLALLGPQVDEPLLLRALMMVEPGRRRLEGLGELLEQGVLERSSTCLQFQQDELREVVLGSLDASHLSTWRRCAALALEEHHADELSPHAALIALHWHAVGDRERALKFYVMAARAARARHDPRQTRRYFEAAIELTAAQSPERVELNGELAVVGYASWGQIQDALRHHRIAVEGARQLKDDRLIGESLLQSTKTLYMAGDVVNAERQAREALRLFEACADTAGAQRVAVSLNLFRWVLGDRRGALESMLQVVPTIDEATDGKLLATAHSHLGLFLREAQSLDAAQEHTSKALTIFERLKHLHAVAFTRGHLAALHYFRGDLDRAIDAFHGALKVARDTREARTVAYMLNDLAECALECDDVEVARAYAQEGLESARLSSAKTVSCLLLSNLGLVELAAGALSDADEKVHSALADARDIGDAGVTCRLIINAARVDRLMGRSRAAEVLLEEALMSAQRIEASFSSMKAQCELGHLRLSGRHSAAPQLKAAQEVIDGVRGLRSAAPAMKALRRLQRAQRLFERGTPLSAGEDPQGLPGALRAALLT